MWRPMMLIGPAIAAMLALALPAAMANGETNLQPGDRVIVTAPQARLMRGSETVATAKRGQELEVLKVEGNWIGTTVESAGESIGGWVWFRQVAPADSAQAQQSLRRRFEPRAETAAPAPRANRPAEPRTARQPSYTLPKTDPNRFH
jgi:hypothetical protein